MKRRLQARVVSLARCLPRRDASGRAAMQAALGALTDKELAALEEALIAEADRRPITPAGSAAQAAYYRCLALPNAVPPGKPKRKW
jgi:hypothetical protein